MGGRRTRSDTGLCSWTTLGDSSICTRDEDYTRSIDYDGTFKPNFVSTRPMHSKRYVKTEVLRRVSLKLDTG